MIDGLRNGSISLSLEATISNHPASPNEGEELEGMEKDVVVSYSCLFVCPQFDPIFVCHGQSVIPPFVYS